MNGLELAKQMVSPPLMDQLKEQLAERRRVLKSEDKSRPAPVAAPTARSREIPLVENIPAPPDWDRHVLTNTPLDQIWRFVNPVMLYGRHLGVKGSLARALGTPEEAELEKTEDGRKALEVKAMMDELKSELKQGGLHARAVFQFFRAGSEGNRLMLFDAQNRPLTQFDFPRQSREGGVCLSDFAAPLNGGPPRDNVCMFVVTGGTGVRAIADGYKAKGEFLRMHAVQALALETAEGFAELLHTQLRSMWGFPDPANITMLERFRAEYHGKRFSFGYPACPRLEDQAQLFSVLKPEEIGVELTDGCMMEPEASVSALVFHHPSAFYYSVT
jgi:5-methyltetrahydrofolate--homocysteine methyltransferase